MKLTLKERFLIEHLLPKEGSYVTLIHLDSFVKTIRMTPNEISGAGVKEIEGIINFGTNIEKDFEISEAVSTEIENTLKRLNDESKLTFDHISLYQKFIVGIEVNDVETPTAPQE